MSKHTFTFRCKKCGQPIEVKTRQSEKQVQCPRCAEVFTVRSQPQGATQMGDSSRAPARCAEPDSSLLPGTTRISEEFREKSTRERRLAWIAAAVIGGIVLVVVAAFLIFSPRGNGRQVNTAGGGFSATFSYTDEEPRCACGDIQQRYSRGWR